MRLATTIVAAALVLTLTGCGSQLHYENLSADVAAQHELLDVPFFKQHTQQCGAAALATVLAYRGEPVSFDELEQQLFTPGKGGTLAIDIVAQARARGMLAYPIQPELHDLLVEVDAGNPVLVMQNLGLSWLPQWHFAVVVGFSLDKRELILRSGTERRHVVPIKTFLNTWQRAKSWGVVILPPNKLPASAQAIVFLQAAAALERQQPLAAEMAYRQALTEWPSNSDAEALARLGLFNVAYSRQDYVQAKAWLLAGDGVRTAAQWNNLAFCLSALRCYQQAEAAIACALHLEPGNPAYRQSQQELRAVPRPDNQTESQAACQITACE